MPSLDFARGRRWLLAGCSSREVARFSGVGRVGGSRVAGWGGLSQGQWVFRGRSVTWSGGYPKAVRMRCQAVAIGVAHRQVVSRRSRTWRAPRVIRAATCRTR